MMVPPYPPGGIPVVDEVPPAPAPDEAGGFWPEWVPTLAPETAVVVASVMGALFLGLFVLVLVLRLRGRKSAGGQGPDGPAQEGGETKRDPWIPFLLMLVMMMTPVMLGLTFYGSFHAVEGLASDHGVHPSWIPPLAIDGILLLFLFVDLLLARLDRMNEAVKATTRGFIGLTLVANAVSGWPDPVAVLLHVPAPLALVVMTEVARKAILDEASTEKPDRFDKVPMKRWLLDPVGTASLRRWMILHHVTDYRRALAADMARRDALAILRALTPSQRAQVPGHLSRRLRQGMNLVATVREVRMLAATVTSGYHLAPVVSRVDEVGPVAGSSTVGVGGVDPHEAAPPAPGVDVHSDPTPGPTPAPDGGVEAAPGGVGHGVDEADTVRVSDMSDTPAPGVPSTPAPAVGVDEVEAVPDGLTPGVDVHPGPVWRSPGAHPHTVEAAPNGAGHRVEANTPAPTPAPTVTTDGDHDEDEDDTDPDDEGPGPRGGGVPAPAPADVLPGQITITDALEGAPTPGPLDVARLALDAPVWDDVADEKPKKPKVMALLWEHAGDVTAARAAWQDRMTDEFPRDVYRSGSRGYAWQWHHEVTAYLISEYGHADTVRAVLAAAGVDHHHEAVSAALDAWADTHGSQVLQFRRPTPTGS